MDIDAITERISKENDKILHSLSKKLGVIPPTFDRHPHKNESQPNGLGRLLDYSENLPGDREVLGSREVDSINFSYGLGNIPLTESVNEGSDLRYRVHGANVTQFSSFSLTRKSISEIIIPSGSQKFYQANYKAKRLRCAPVFAMNYSSLQETLRQWNRISLQFANADGAIDRFVAEILLIEHLP